jgi:hypothetical protein
VPLAHINQHGLARRSAAMGLGGADSGKAIFLLQLYDLRQVDRLIDELGWFDKSSSFHNAMLSNA